MTDAPRRLALPVWQFVRLMVRIEESGRSDPARAALLEDWNEDWRTLDGELERLNGEDFAAFAQMMMDQEVAFEAVPADRRRTVAAVLREVAKELRAKARKAGGEARADLDYEAQELSATAATIDGGPKK